MDKTTAHTPRRRQRRTTAVILMAMFLIISVSPLFSAAMYAATLSPALTRDCTGDCTLCGCSPESRASNSCCCSKKRSQEARIHDEDDADSSDCCNVSPSRKKVTVLSCGCPCGSGSDMPATGALSSELLPYHFTDGFTRSLTETLFFNRSPLLTSRHLEPPDHPPRHSLSR